MRVLYFPGCKIPSQLPQYDMATRAVLQRLGVELVEPEFNCCGYPARHQYFEASIYSAARVLALAAHHQLPVMTPCKCCFGNLRQAHYWLERHTRLAHKTVEMLRKDGLVWNPKGIVVRHLMQILDQDIGTERLGRMVAKPFKGLRVAAHYGCHALRPANVTRFDNPLAPTLFERLVETTGAQCVDWPLRLECCGAPLQEKQTEVALKLIHRKQADAVNSEAHLLLTACTYCQLQFDGVAQEVTDGETEPAPLAAVLLPQLLGLAMGIEPRILGLPLNRTQLDFSPFQ